METRATEKMEVRTCGCCGPSAGKTERVAVGAISERGTSRQDSTTATEMVTKKVASTCDCGCETSGCDCGCECCEP